MDDDNNQSNAVQVEKSCFSYGFRPIYYFSRALGLMPYSVIYNLNGEIQEHRFHIGDGLWLLSSSCLYIVVIVHVCRDMKLPEEPNSTMYIFILGNDEIISFNFRTQLCFHIKKSRIDPIYINSADMRIWNHCNSEVRFESVLFEPLNKYEMRKCSVKKIQSCFSKS